MRLASAGNVEVPAYLALLEKGYQVSWDDGDDQQFWFAAKDGHEFIGDGPLELLGLVALYETRGENWPATNQQIDDFLKSTNQS